MEHPQALSEALLDALEEFDQSTAPLGLYASEELMADGQFASRKSARRPQEWHRCIAPLLQRLRCGVQDYLNDPWAWVTVRDFGVIRLHLIKISKIKVRKYGSCYRIDNHENYKERWQQLRMDRLLSDLWSPSSLAQSDVRLRILVFIGFDKADDPFGRELSRLHQDLNWDNQGASYSTRTWADRYERGFHVRLSAWTRLA